MSKHEIEVDHYVGFDINGKNEPTVYSSVMFGDTDLANPDETLFSDVLDEFVSGNVIPGGIIRQDAKDELKRALYRMAEIVRDKYKEVEALPLWRPFNES